MTESDASRTLRTLLDTVGCLALLCVVAVVALVALPSVVGVGHSYVVRSGSMHPAFDAGDVVVVTGAPPASIERGDVIAFTHGDSQPTTHRVVEVVDGNGALRFRTKGDANEEADAALVPADAVVGVVRFHVPYVGRALLFARSDAGLLGLFVLPAAFLGLWELWSLLGSARAAEGTALAPDRNAAEELDGSGEGGLP